MQAFISAVAHLPTSDTCAGWLITKRTAMYFSCRSMRSNVLATFVASIWKHTVREELHGRGDACGFATNPVTFFASDAETITIWHGNKRQHQSFLQSSPQSRRQLRDTDKTSIPCILPSIALRICVLSKSRIRVQLVHRLAIRTHRITQPSSER